jgi:hypothetical protein
VLCTSAEMILATTRQRLGIHFRKRLHSDPFTWPRWVVVLKPFFYALPAVPTLYGILYTSTSALRPWWHTAVAIVPGIVAAALLSILSNRVRDKLREVLLRGATRTADAARRILGTKPARKFRSTRLGNEASALYNEFKRSLDEVFKDLHVRVPLGLIIVTAGVYIAGAFLLDPAYGLAIAEHVPAMAYVLLITIILGWVMPALAMYFDRFRLSPVLVLVVVVLAFYVMFDSDHYYDIEDIGGGGSAGVSDGAAADTLTPKEVVQAWRKHNPDATGMVVVATSGGGISAAMWTSKVLTSLAADESFGESFGKSMVLISSVSGGSVGSMYFVDGYDAAGPPDAVERAAALANSQRSSLAVTAWGMAYPDLWRTIAPWLIRSKARDRGWAQEQLWRKGLDDGDVSLHDWRRGVAGGYRPATIFNATVTETGERFLLTPIDIPSTWKARAFLTQYPGKSIKVVTAARLSATFPYISPIAQARYNGEPLEPTLHLADGGYYDNFGVMSVVEWLDDVLPYAKNELGLERVLVVQIRSEKKPETQTTQRGWIYAAIGPAVTFWQVRNTSQISRNDLEIELMQSRWADDGVAIKPVVFALGGAGPLSWQLSATEKMKIHDAWECREGAAVSKAICGKNEKAAEGVAAFFGGAVK